MADNTKIEWTDATWNPIRGCTRVSEGCRNCYAEVMAARFSDPGQWGHGLAKRVTLPGGGTDHRWTGKVQFVEDKLNQPLRWRKPRMIFVNSTSDLFHENVPDEWIDRVFAVMALAYRHTFQVLTKRPDRARAYLARFKQVIGVGDRVTAGASRWDRVEANGPPFPEYITRDGVQEHKRDGGPLFFTRNWPLPNVWIGTSVEDQATADERIPHLLATPAAVRFVSAEPLLGPVDLTRAIPGTSRSPLLGGNSDGSGSITDIPSVKRLDWVIVGGESGPGARVWPGFEDAARSLRDQCRSASVAFFMKQMAGPQKVSMPPIPDDLMVREFPHGAWAEAQEATP